MIVGIKKFGKPGVANRIVTLDSLLNAGYVSLGFKKDAPDNSVPASIAWNIEAQGYIIDEIRDIIIWDFVAKTKVNEPGAADWGGQYNRKSVNVNTNTGAGTFSNQFDTGKNGVGTATFRGVISFMPLMEGYSEFQGGAVLRSVTAESQGTGNVGFASTRHEVEGILLVLPPL